MRCRDFIYLLSVCAVSTLHAAVLNASAGDATTAVRWIGNTETFPAYGSVDPDTAFWFNTEVLPAGVAEDLWLGYSLDAGESWTELPMAQNGTAEDREKWHVQVPGFAAGTELRYYIRARNGAGEVFWDNNRGADYRLRVNSLIRDVYTDRSRYSPGETATIQVDLYNTQAPVEATLRVRVHELTSELAVLEKSIDLPQWSGRTVEFPWPVPVNDFRGYGVDVDLLVDGVVRDTRSTALDVSSDWTKFPRYGFFSNFYPGEDTEAKARELSKFHINAVQFYDWMWTHDQLVPYNGDEVADIFTQFDGRVQSFGTIRELVAESKARGMFTMGYSLIYGDSGNEAGPEQLKWASFTEPYATTADKVRTHDASWKLWIMDVTNPEWRSHIFTQFRDAIQTVGFEGIHLDNLGGVWNYRYDSDQGIPEWTGFPDFINSARAEIRSVFPEARIAHNDVAENYLDDIVRSDADIYYTEVWGRHSYNDLRKAILRGQSGSGNTKQVVLAAYINRLSWEAINDPAPPPLPTYVNDASALLLNATIFANGGFHIELGERGELLVNEFFPLRSPRMHPGLKRRMRDYYDFIVRYENFLFFNTLGNLYDGTEGMQIGSDSHALSKDGRSDRIWTVTKIWRDEYDSLSLINLYGVDTSWRDASANPTPQEAIQIKYYVDKKARRVLLATPDDGLGRSVELPFTEGIDKAGYFVSFTVPSLEFWDLVIVDKTSEIKIDGWPHDWTGAAPAQIHASQVSEGDWIYRGEAGDHRSFSGATSDSDITEVRVRCDNTYVYFLIRMAAIADATLPAIGIALDTDQQTTGGSLGNWIGDESTPTGSIALDAPVQSPERQLMFYADASGSPRIRLWNGSQWTDPPTPDSAIVISAADNAIEVRINKNDLGVEFPQRVGLSLASFRSSGRDTGDDATYDSPDGNNDAIDLMGGAPGVSANAWTRDLSDDRISHFAQFVLEHDGAKALWIGEAWHFPSDGEIDASSDVWLNVETWPPAAADSVTTRYALDSSAWVELPMIQNGSEAGNDRWHLNLGRFNPSAVIDYAFYAEDPAGSVVWDRNGGSNYRLQVNATALDSDGDGISDWWTQAFFGHAEGDSGDRSMAHQDADGDGRSNYEEFVTSTHPLDAHSRFGVTSVQSLPEEFFEIRWQSVPGKTYQIEAADQPGGYFAPVSGRIEPAGDQATYIDRMTETKRFYRVRIYTP